jgi:hypothetical protein
MIIQEPPCKVCGQSPHPLKIKCDQCGKEHVLPEFRGTVIHFELRVDEECDEDCSTCTRSEDDSIIEEETAEFHFCNLRCLSEYIVDPNPAKSFDEYEDRLTSLLIYPEDVPNLLFTLGGASYDD